MPISGATTNTAGSYQLVSPPLAKKKAHHSRCPLWPHGSLLPDRLPPAPPTITRVSSIFPIQTSLKPPVSSKIDPSVKKNTMIFINSLEFDEISQKSSTSQRDDGNYYINQIPIALPTYYFILFHPLFQISKTLMRCAKKDKKHLSSYLSRAPLQAAAQAAMQSDPGWAPHGWTLDCDLLSFLSLRVWPRSLSSEPASWLRSPTHNSRVVH